MEAWMAWREDEKMILSLVATEGPKWSKIALELPGRSAKKSSFASDYLRCAVARRAAWRFGRAQRGGSRSLTGSACAGVHRRRSVATKRSLAKKLGLMAHLLESRRPAMTHRYAVRSGMRYGSSKAELWHRDR